MVGGYMWIYQQLLGEKLGMNTVALALTIDHSI